MIDPRQFEPVVRLGKYLTWTTLAVGIGAKKQQKGIIEKSIYISQFNTKGTTKCNYINEYFGNCIMAEITVNIKPHQGLPEFPSANIVLPPLSSGAIYVGNLKKNDKVYVSIYPVVLSQCVEEDIDKFTKVIEIKENIDNAYIKITNSESKIIISPNSNGEYSVDYSFKAKAEIVKLINAPKNTFAIAHLNFSNFGEKIDKCNTRIEVGISADATIRIITKSNQIISISSTKDTDTATMYSIVLPSIYTKNARYNIPVFVGLMLHPLKVKKNDTLSVKITDYRCNNNNPNQMIIDFIATATELVPGKLATPQPIPSRHNTITYSKHELTPIKPKTESKSSESTQIDKQHNTIPTKPKTISSDSNSESSKEETKESNVQKTNEASVLEAKETSNTKEQTKSSKKSNIIEE